MRAEIINAFYEAAISVLENETKALFYRREMTVDRSDTTQEEVAILVGVTGAVRGIVVYEMDADTARNIASHMVGERLLLYDRMTESALGELGNMITGRASMKLENHDLTSDISPPSVITGRGVLISTVRIPAISILVASDDFGQIRIRMSLQEKQ